MYLVCDTLSHTDANRMKGGIKWGLVAYTAAMFLFVTTFTAKNLGIQSVT